MMKYVGDYVLRVQVGLAQEEFTPFYRLAEALCLPSFHPETLLRVTGGPAGTSIGMVTFGSSLWYSETGRAPTRCEETAGVPLEQAARFWDEIEAVMPEAVRERKGIGLDGMTVKAAYRRGDTLESFEAWSPGPASSSGKFVHLLYDLAWDRLTERICIERLEQLHGYLNLGLPARFIDGDVRCLRIFGSLSSYDRKELKSLLDSLRNDEPLVLDMTNFEGMGTVLYPIFIEFASQRCLSAWACSNSARRHIESMGLTSAHIFGDTKDAIAWVKRVAARLDAGANPPESFSV
jgi:hypothetical protein